ncbi:hypothetical protein BDV95DRAFT_585096 [Massariosphaeria phaeospora]|uniref:FAD-binding domain-containing protein n=1 Tax=Massariosphaeria phaeospora TaxID=100035 RepID=A0A7C8HZG0_9PLEO|nr:hypothetical protein BDV95DRAFT_585096 [Massariosphaeria phaeospora]
MRVLISGAGVAGPTLAWFLARSGARITILEKAPSLLPHGQNVDMQGSAVTVIKKMGLLDEFRRFNTKECGTQIVNSKGQPIAPFPISEGSMTSFTSEFEILRGDLAKLLHEATKDHPNVDYVFGTTIKQVVTNDDESVKVELSNGEVQEFDLLVAADGQWSKVRKQVFPSESVKVVPMGMYAAYYTIPRQPNDNDWWNVFFALRSRIITLRPDPHGTIRALFSHMPSTDAEEAEWRDASRGGRLAQEKLLKKTFADAGWQAPRILDAVDQAPDFYFHVIEQIKMSHWSNSRVVCLGDTAYAPSPLTGMGTSLALIGAYMLAGELSKLKEGEHPAKALAAYENEFRPFVDKEQKIPSFIPAIAHPGTAWKRVLLQSLLWVMSQIAKIPWVKNRVADAESDNDGFTLPDYPMFEAKRSQ